MLWVAASHQVGDLPGHLQLLVEAERAEHAPFGVNGAVDVAVWPDFSAMIINALAQPAVALIPGLTAAMKHGEPGNPAAASFHVFARPVEGASWFGDPSR